MSSATPWHTLKFNQRDFHKKIAVLNRHAHPDTARSHAVSEIIAAVRHEGDTALIRFSARWDNVTLSPNGLLVSERAKTPSMEVRDAIEYSMDNIRSFSKLRKPRSWQRHNREGALVGEKFEPLERVGIYVPGGSAPLISTALMTVTLAKEAKVREIVVATPPPIAPVLLYALRTAGATEIYQVGGAQAIAAMAYGTITISRVQKIFGPGNAYVVEAKRQVMGAVSIDQLPGPSEVAIVADDTAKPEFIAADLLAQAEHGSGGQLLFLTPSAKLMAAVEAEVVRQEALLTRKEQLASVLAKGCWFVLVEDIGEAIGIVEDFAPEHLTLVIKDARPWANTVRNAGAVFIGNYSPVAAGDFVAGPSHVLPTGGAAKSFSGLTIDQFYRRTSMVEYPERSLFRVRHHIELMAEMEQLDAHKESIAIRFATVKKPVDESLETSLPSQNSTIHHDEGDKIP